MKVMNILMMTNTYLPHVGGVARSVHTFAEEYRKKAHQVMVVAPTFDGAADAQPEEGVVRLPALQNFNGSDFSVRLPLTGLYNDQIDAFEANIVHSHHPFLLGDTALRVAAAKHVPVVFTHHTLYEEYTHYVPFDSTALKQFTIELSTQYANLCDAVIAPSESIAKLIHKRGVESQIAVIPTGIDTSGFASGNRQSFRAALGIPPKAFVVGHLGRLAPEKNVAYLSRAVCAFLKKDSRAVFLVIGGGPQDAEIQSVFREEGLEGRLYMPGKKTGRDLFDAYAAMDVFVFSSFSETQGLVVAEAMAAGLPVVALDASGVREVVQNGCNGFLLAADANKNAFAEALIGVRSNKELRQKLRRGATVTAHKFSRECCADKALSFYEFVRAQTRRQRHVEKTDIWAALLKRIDVEWGLLVEKSKAAVTALLAEPETEQGARDLST